MPPRCPHGVTEGRGRWKSAAVGVPRCPLGVPAVSQQEGDDGGAQRRVVAELPQVAAVFALRPDRHLHKAHQREERHCGDTAVREHGGQGTRGGQETRRGSRGVGRVRGHGVGGQGTWQWQGTQRGPCWAGHGGNGDAGGPGDLVETPSGGAWGFGGHGAGVKWGGGVVGGDGHRDQPQGDVGSWGWDIRHRVAPVPLPPKGDTPLHPPRCSPLTRQTLGHDGEADPGPDLGGGAAPIAGAAPTVPLPGMSQPPPNAAVSPPPPGGSATVVPSPCPPVH